jgi:hypothetical protein
MDNILQFKKFSTINQLGKNRHISDYEYYKNIESSYREALFKKLINNPSQQNVYTYVQNNPINHIDPKGLIQTPCEDERFFCQRTCSMICIAATVPDMGPEIIPLCLLSCKVACDSAYHCNCH